MEGQIESRIRELQTELDQCHQIIKDSTDFSAKQEAIRKAAVLTARYLDEIYQVDGLYNYRRIEKMAAELPEMVRGQLEIARRHQESSGWRADIALNSLGLDLYIMHTRAEEIAQDSGKLPVKKKSRKAGIGVQLMGLLRRLQMIWSMWNGRHRRKDQDQVKHCITQAEALNQE